MFSVGIFTTHTPYVLMLVFYAWFLISGVNKTSEGKINLTEKSLTIQKHINGTGDYSNIDTFAYYSALTENNYKIFDKITTSKQKWKRLYYDDFISQDDYADSLFSRPPPVS